MRPPFELHTDALHSNGFFDVRYTCDSDNSSPELRWSDPPEDPDANETLAGFALIVEDLDSPKGPFTHWVVYDIPPIVRHLPAGIPAQDALPNGIRQGFNGAGKLGYVGPCPASGDPPHRYAFRLYALSSLPELPNRATRDQVLEATRGRLLATAELQGRYQRPIQKAG